MSSRWAATVGAFLREPEVGTEAEGERGPVAIFLPSGPWRRWEQRIVAGQPAEAAGWDERALSEDRGGGGADGGWAPRGVLSRPQPPPLPAQRLTDRGRGHSSHSSPRPSPQLQSNLGWGSPSLELRTLASAASNCGVTGCRRRQVPLASLPPSGLGAGKTLALGAGLQEERWGALGEGPGGRALG